MNTQILTSAELSAISGGITEPGFIYRLRPFYLPHFFPDFDPREIRLMELV